MGPAAIIDIVLQSSNSGRSTISSSKCWSPEAGPQQTYFRFQVELSQSSSAMDDASGPHLKQLMDITQDYLTHPDTRDSLNRLCARLTA